MSNKIDINNVVAPIEGKDPVGERTFLRDQLMKDRKYDKRIDPIDNKVIEIKPDWKKIVVTSLEALEKMTKDLWIAAVLTEALIHTQGFPGLCTGLKIQAGLLGNYWENVYPSKDNEGEDVIEILGPRLSPINYMNDTLSGCIKEIPITDTSKSVGYSWIKWQESRGENGKDSKTIYGFVDEKTEKLSAEEFDSAVNSSSKEFYESLSKNMDLSLEALKEFEEIVNNKFGKSVTLLKSSPLLKSGENDIPAEVLEKLKPLQGKEFVSEIEFENALEKNIGKEGTSQYKSLILENTKRVNNAPSLDKVGESIKKCQKVATEILKDKRSSWEYSFPEEEGLCLMSAIDRSERDIIIRQFNDKFESNDETSVILIVDVALDENPEWTIAGFSDNEGLKTVLIDENSDELEIELNKEGYDRKKIIELASSCLGRLPGQNIDESNNQTRLPKKATSEELLENKMWKEALETLKNGGIKNAIRQLYEASCSVPSVRGKNRYNLLMAKLCMKADRPELARPIVEDLYKIIEDLKLERWESPMWIAEIYDVLYKCLTTGTASPEDKKRAEGVYMKTCTIKEDLTYLIFG